MGINVRRSTAIVTPRDNSSAAAIANNLRTRLIEDRSRDRHAVRRPFQAPICIYPLSINVIIGAASVIIPGDNSPATAITGYLRPILGVCRSRDRHTVHSPEEIAISIYPLGINIAYCCPVVPVVLPYYNGPAAAVANNLGSSLVVDRSGDSHTVCRPEDIAVCVYSLRVNVISIAASVILPGNYGPAAAVACYLRIILVVCSGANHCAVCRPEDITVCIYPLCINIVIPIAIIFPYYYGPAAAVTCALSAPLVAGRRRYGVIDRRVG